MWDRGQFGSANSDSFLSEFNSLSQFSQTKHKVFRRAIQSAFSQKTLDIYVGSCPDYSHRNGFYTLESLGSGVPLLTTVHLGHDLALLKLLDRFELPYRYIIMIADVEATDDVFADKFANGSQSEFLSKCQESQIRSAEYVEKLKSEHELSGELVASSFFDQFTQESFMHYQQQYQSVLTDRYQTDSSFHSRVVSDIIARRNMYRSMYGGVLNSRNYQEFLAERTMRTMAQYLTLGRLICNNSENPLIINHPTRNLGMFNDRNKFSLPEDPIQPSPTIPIITLNQEVYS